MMTYTIAISRSAWISYALAESDLVALADGISSHEAEAFAPELRGH